MRPHPARSLLRDAVVTATMASATATGLGMCLARRRGKPAAALPHAIAHMTDGTRAARRQDGAERTLTGLALNFVGCLAWACVAETWARVRPYRQPLDVLARGLAMASTAYAVDMHVLPPHARPAYDEVLTGGARVALYASLAATLTGRAAMTQLAGAFGSNPHLG